MTAIAILIPVLNRPHRVAPLMESIEASGRFTDLYPVFLVSPGDTAELAAVEAARVTVGDDYDDNLFPLVVDWQPGAGDYARKINHGFEWVLEGSFEFALLAADDLVFHPGWAERALACYLEHPGACVIGTNDCANPKVLAGEHSTHPLVHRDYVGCGLVDDPDGGKILCEKYDHSYVDSELVGTAAARGAWVMALDSRVEHRHPAWGTAPADETYRKGQRAIRDDARLFSERRSLWEAV